MLTQNSAITGGGSSEKVVLLPALGHFKFWGAPFFCAHYFRDNYGPYAHPWGVREKLCRYPHFQINRPQRPF